MGEREVGSTRQPTKQLTARKVETAGPGKHFDGNGLFLLVKPSGARSWVQRLQYRGHDGVRKRREIGLGSPPFVSLAAAREAAFANRRLALSGGDPLAEKHKTKAVLTYEEAARRAHAELAPQYKNPKDRAAFLATQERYVFPRIGGKAVQEVTSADIRQLILAVREKRPEVARKLTLRISAVMKWAIAEGLRPDNPATADALALPRAPKVKEHFAALPYQDVARCIDAVRGSGAYFTTRLALEFTILTAKRSSEVRLATWNEIDEAARTWTIPAERMKTGREHRVPLSDRAMEILAQARPFQNESNLLFPSAHGKALSDATMLKLVKDLGFQTTIHGFRTSFRTWAQEQTDAPREVAEAALAHAIGDAVEQSYARSDVFEKRRDLMNAWVNYLT